MVTAQHERLHITFAAALAEGGFTSWAGEGVDSTKWLVKKLGDLYLHETVIAHIRRLHDTDFASGKIFETPSQFRVRMQKVEDHMNSAAFTRGWRVAFLSQAASLPVQRYSEEEGRQDTQVMVLISVGRD